MLLRFICNNFLSFKDDFDFKMGTNENKTKNNLGSHIYRYNQKYIKILKGSIIYGPNASGKSNFLKAIEYSKNFILFGKNYLKAQQNKFSNTDETKFEYFFLIENVIYNYGFVLDSKQAKATVVEEWLVQKSALSDKIKNEENDKVIFEREGQRFTNENFDFTNTSTDFIKFSKQTCSETELFLKKLSDNKLKFATDIIDWFRKIVVVHNSEGISTSKQLELYTKLNFADKNVINFITKNIKKIDSQISDINFQSVEKNEDEIREIIKKNLDNYKLNNEQFQEITEEKERILENLKNNNNGTLILNDNGKIFFIAREDNKFVKKEFCIFRNKKTFSLFEESDGINKIIELLLSLYLVKENELILFIDEIETNLHPLLLRYFIKLFYEINENNTSQLISTTHNILLINHEMFKKNEIRFIEKDNNLNSINTSLNEYKIRDDLDYMKAYLNNRFGALPDLK